MRIAVLILAVLGGLACLGLGLVWKASADSPLAREVLEIKKEIEKGAKDDPEFFNKRGMSETKFREAMSDLDRVLRAMWILLGVGPLAIVGGVVAMMGKRFVAGPILLVAGIAPLPFAPITIITTFFVLVAGGLAFLIKPSASVEGGGGTRRHGKKGKAEEDEADEGELTEEAEEPEAAEEEEEPAPRGKKNKRDKAPEPEEEPAEEAAEEAEEPALPARKSKVAKSRGEEVQDTIPNPRRKPAPAPAKNAAEEVEEPGEAREVEEEEKPAPPAKKSKVEKPPRDVYQDTLPNPQRKPPPALVPIPAPTSPLVARIGCPKCKAPLKIVNPQAGQSIKCPKCATGLKIPQKLVDQVRAAAQAAKRPAKPEPTEEE